MKTGLAVLAGLVAAFTGWFLGTYVPYAPYGVTIALAAIIVSMYAYYGVKK